MLSSTLMDPVIGLALSGFALGNPLRPMSISANVIISGLTEGCGVGGMAICTSDILLW